MQCSYMMQLCGNKHSAHLVSYISMKALEHDPLDHSVQMKGLREPNKEIKNKKT